MEALIAFAWALMPWVMVILMLFVGFSVLRRLDALESFVADYADLIEPDEDH